MLLQFLIEAVTLALVGGGSACYAALQFAESVTLLIGMPSAIKLWAVAAGLLVRPAWEYFWSVSRAQSGAAGSHRGAEFRDVGGIWSLSDLAIEKLKFKPLELFQIIQLHNYQITQFPS